MIQHLRTAIIAVLVFSCSPSAVAKGFNWHFQNLSGRTVHVELYAKSRSHVWPGNGIVWVIPPNGTRYTNRISCRRGENICYGAWPKNESGYWGAGRGGTQGCNNCCYYCRGGGTQIIKFHGIAGE